MEVFQQITNTIPITYKFLVITKTHLKQPRIAHQENKKWNLHLRRYQEKSRTDAARIRSKTSCEVIVDTMEKEVPEAGPPSPASASSSAHRPQPAAPPRRTAAAARVAAASPSRPAVAAAASRTRSRTPAARRRRRRRRGSNSRVWVKAWLLLRAVTTR